MKGQIDYKLPKKMKKRRQLDALVDTVKLPRSRKSSASAQELLDCQTDSSENDEFTIPQSNAKRKSRCCICQSIAARIGLFMVTMACLTTCVGLVWVQWHIRHELDSLRQQLASVQNSKTFSPEVLKLQSQLAEMNKSVTNMKSGPNGLQDITNTITDISLQIKELSDANTKIQTSVSASGEVLGLPAKMNDLSSTVVTLGSDFKDFMNVQTTKYEDLLKRITALETETKKENESPLLNSEMFTQELMNYNKSLVNGLKGLSQDLEKQSTRISTLEEFTKSHFENAKPDVTDEKITEIITKVLQDKAIAPLKQADEEFKLFKTEVWSNLKQINDTILGLNGRLQTSDGHQPAADGVSLSPITATTQPNRKDLSQSSTSSPVVVETTTPYVTPPSHQSSAVKHTREEGSNSATALHIDGINTLDDLTKAFNESLPTKDSQLDIEAVKSLTNMTISEEKLKQFDGDANGLYSKDEIAAALGLKRSPR